MISMKKIEGLHIKFRCIYIAMKVNKVYNIVMDFILKM